MIYIKRVIRCAILISSLLIMAGCEFRVAPDELIKPPKMLEENERISTIIERNIPSEASLESIDSEDGLSAVKIVDVDQNGSEEILVFYSMADSLNLIVLEEAEGTHRIKLNMEVEGNFFEEFMLEDITGSGINEIIITTSKEKGRDSQKSMSIYSYSKDNAKIFQADYTEYVIEDLSVSGEMDIIIFKGENDLLSADYYRYNTNSNQVEFVNEVLIEYFQNLLRPKIVNISDKKKAILIEAGYLSAREESYATFLSLDEAGRLKNLLEKDSEELHFPYIYSSEKIESADINGDGSIEVSQTLHMVGELEGVDYFSLSEYTKFRSWYGWQDESLEVLTKEIVIDENMTIKVPKNWDIKTIIGREEEVRRRKEISFTVLNQDKEEEILRLVKSENKDILEGFTKIGEYKGIHYMYRLPDSISDDLSDYRISAGELESLISLGE